MSAQPFNEAVLPFMSKLKERARQFTSYDSEDLVQETLLRAWRVWGKYEVQNVWGWLWRIMRNAYLDTCQEAAQVRAATQAHLPEIADVRARAPRPPNAGVTEGPDDDLLRAVQRLPEAQRTILELQILGMDSVATARHLRIDPRTVRTAAWKARARIRAVL